MDSDGVDEFLPDLCCTKEVDHCLFWDMSKLPVQSPYTDPHTCRQLAPHSASFGFIGWQTWNIYLIDQCLFRDNLFYRIGLCTIFVIPNGIKLLFIIHHFFLQFSDKFQVLNMVCLGTTFQLCEVVRFGAGQPSSAECLRALKKRWFSWRGHSVNIACDRGLHNRGVMKKYMDEHGIQVFHTPLESPENLGRVERHGGIVKSLFRKVCKETGAIGREQVEQVLLEVVSTKNNSSRVGGFSPSQWVLGKGPRSDPSPLSEERFAELGAIEARHNPESIFALQHMARQEAQKAFVHLDCSARKSPARLLAMLPVSLGSTQ